MPDERRAAAFRCRRLVRRRRLAALGVGAAVLGLLVLWVGGRIASPDLTIDGPHQGVSVGAAQLASLGFAAETGDPARLRWTLDGKDVSADATLDDRGVSTYRSAGLADGAHRVEVHVGSSFPFSSREHAWAFSVDTAPPTIELPGGPPMATSGLPFTLHGSVEDGARLVVNGVSRRVRGGAFAVRFPLAPPTVELVAVDRAGNRSTLSARVALVPRRPDQPVRGVHMSALSWANDKLRAGVLRMVDKGLINTVELDLKDESGEIGYDSSVALGRKIGAVKGYYDLGAAVKQLHAKGVRVIGRLVAFRDPVLAAAAWDAGDKEQVIQTPAGKPYAGYGGFTNFANPVVQAYNVDVAREAAELGVDDILYDYVRRPDGPIDSMVFPGLKGSADRAIVGFLEATRKALRPTGAFLGASVFGIAATRPDEIAQNVPLMASHVDYVAPMLYPSHWGAYEYDLPNPDSEPYAIVRRSLPDFVKDVRGTGARVVPWLQDFSLQSDYGPDQVRAQIRGARAAGIHEFLLWDPAVTYDAAALKPGRT
jgi:hypothetical protein